MFLADTLSRATINQPNNESQRETEDVMLMQDTRSTTEREVEQIDILENLSVKESTLARLKQQTEADSTLQALMTVVKEGWPRKIDELIPALRLYHPFRDELTGQDGVILKGERLIVPEEMRPEMTERLHENHGGIQSTLRRARDVFYWPGMNKNIEELVAKCHICSAYQTKHQKEPLMSHPVPTRPWESIATDLFQLRGKDYLVTADYYSNFIEVDRLYKKTSSEVINKLKAHMARHGIPERVVSDNGPQYSSDEFKNFAAKYEFEHVTSSPRYPQSNGKAESAVKTVKRIMEKALAARSDPYLALLEHRNTPSDGMTSSPAQRLFARRTRTRLPTSSRLLEPACAKSAKQELQKAKSKQADYYNKGTKQLPVLKRGDVVRIMPKEGEKTWKLGKVKAVVSPRSYIVTTLDGVNYRRNRRHLRKTAEPEEEETNVDTSRGNEQQDQQPVLAPEQQDVPRLENNTVPSAASGPPTSRAASGRQTRRPAYLDDYVTET